MYITPDSCIFFKQCLLHEWPTPLSAIKPLFNIKEIDNYLGEYIKDRAIKRGETTTTVMKRGDSWKVLVKYIK